MALEDLPFGPGALVVLGLYVAVLLGIGVWSSCKSTGSTMEDHFLAGRSMPFPVVQVESVLPQVLLLTLFATQYSGNSLFMNTGNGYQKGFRFLVMIPAMVSVCACYLLFVPKLYQISKSEGFITPADFLFWRYKSRPLCCVANLVMVTALLNYVLAQLKVMGLAVAGLTAGAVPASYGCIGLALVMAVYETVGGMRGVAWTDVLQGVMLLLGIGTLAIIQVVRYGPVDTALLVAEGHQELVSSPDWTQSLEWASYSLLLGSGLAMYPHALQRVFAAKSATALKNSLAVMCFLPFVGTLPPVMMGIGVVPYYDVADADQVFAVICRDVMVESQLGYCAVVLVVCAVVAAVMSTTDSALLAISSMITKDLLVPTILAGKSERTVLKVAKMLSWVVLGSMLLLSQKEVSLLQLMKLKTSMLAQLAPAFVLGCRSSTVTASAVSCGLGTGLAFLASFSVLTEQDVYLGIYSGMWGLLGNLLVIWLWQRFCTSGQLSNTSLPTPREDETQESVALQEVTHQPIVMGVANEISTNAEEEELHLVHRNTHTP